MKRKTTFTRVRRPLGPAVWYLESDHLLVSNQRLFWAEYHRFYFADLRSITFWPAPRYWIRVGLKVLLAGLITWLMALLNSTIAVIVVLAAGVALVARELEQGPDANTRLETTHGIYHIPLASRMRHGPKLLEQIARQRAELAPAAQAAAE